MKTLLFAFLLGSLQATYFTAAPTTADCANVVVNWPGN